MADEEEDVTEPEVVLEVRLLDDPEDVLVDVPGKILDRVLTEKGVIKGFHTASSAQRG